MTNRTRGPGQDQKAKGRERAKLLLSSGVPTELLKLGAVGSLQLEDMPSSSDGAEMRARVTPMLCTRMHEAASGGGLPQQEG